MRGAADHETHQRTAAQENGEPTVPEFGGDWLGIFISPVSLRGIRRLASPGGAPNLLQSLFQVGLFSLD
jgi:hypothetical protein